jgi:pyrroline-5-carboxylate reductase
VLSAVVTGACSSEFGDQFSIILSPRNAEKAALLQSQFPKQVHQSAATVPLALTPLHTFLLQVSVKSSNQEVVDACSWVVLAVTPQTAREVISQLSFKPEHRLLTLVAIVTSEELADWTGVSVENIFRAVPLPPVAKQRGVTVIAPPNPAVKELFDLLGQAVEVNTTAELLTLQTVTCLMGPYYEQLRAVRDWAAAQGM